MERNNIIIKNARTHNLKDISVSIPKHKLVVFTGVSGSGKSSLLFDTIYTEAQRQLIETFSTFARARMPKLSRPDVDDIHNLSTAIVIDQKRMGNNLRSTVGTATEINTYLRLLFSRFGSPFIGPSFYLSFNHPEGMCPHCHGLGKRIQIDISMLVDKEKSLREGALVHPECKVGGWFWREIISIGLFDPDKKLKDYSTEELNKLLFTEPVPITKSHGAGTYSKNYEGIARKLERTITAKAEDEGSENEKDIYKKYFIYSDCDKCGGTRLNQRALSVKIMGKTIANVCELELIDALTFLREIKDDKALSVKRKAEFLLDQLVEIGVGYLTLSRAVSTLSGGESQRVKLARQLDCNLTDLMYILDEPSIGLHSRDTDKMLTIIKRLKENGNSVFIVEHDPDIIKQAEWIVDIGPKAGTNGGNLVYNGEFSGIFNSESITAKYLKREHPINGKRKSFDSFLTIENASIHNLKNVSVKIPKGVLTCITGVAGSGKSSLVNHCLIQKYPDVIHVDQSVIGKSSRANPATYIGMFDAIRKLFANATGENAALFSFNSKGACPKCNGQGFIALELHFLDSVKTTCDECNGTRFKSEVLNLKYREKSISDVLEMTVDEGLTFFTEKEICKRLRILSEVGLGYIKIGQSLSTLSGGESQRLKLASELHKEGNIYILDEPTTGLHMSDIDKLISIVKSLTSKNNTVIVIEHNLDFIKNADWIIDMGPEGGKNGGEIIFQGLPENLIEEPRSITGKYLRY